MLYIEDLPLFDRLITTPINEGRRVALDDFHAMLTEITKATNGNWRQVTFKCGKETRKFQAGQLVPAEIEAALSGDGAYFIGHALAGDDRKTYRCVWSMFRQVLGYGFKDETETEVTGGDRMLVSVERPERAGYPPVKLASPPVANNAIGAMWMMIDGMKRNVAPISMDDLIA
jgi:hypothetical protein